MLEHSSADRRFGDEISGIYKICLLEGSWLLASLHPDPNPRLLAFNTLLPSGDARSWRILELPRLRDYECYTIQGGDLPTAGFPEFLVDPTQRIFVLPLSSYRKSALAVPVESFTRAMCSARSSPHVQWEDWGKDVVHINLPPDTLALQLAGTVLLALIGYLSNPEGWGVEVYDFSKSGQKDMELQQVRGGCRRVLRTSKWSAGCQIEGALGSTYFMGNKIVCFYVSLLNV